MVSFSARHFTQSTYSILYTIDLLLLPLSKKPRSITERQIHKRLQQHQMENNIPPNQSSQEAENSTRLLQSHRSSSITISHCKVTRCNSKETKINKEKDQNIRNIARKRRNQERKNENRPQYHEESNRIVILGRAGSAVCLRDAERRCQDCSEASVEKT